MANFPWVPGMREAAWPMAAATPGDLTFADAALIGVLAGQLRLIRRRFPFGDPDANVIAEWPFDEGSGTTAADRTGAFPCALGANVRWTTRDGAVVGVMGTGGTGLLTNFSFGAATQITVEAVVYVHNPFGSRWGTIFTYNLLPNRLELIITAAAKVQAIVAGTGGASVLTGATVVTPGWHVLRVTVDTGADQAKIYLDDMTAAEASGTARAFSGAGLDAAEIGNDAGSAQSQNDSCWLGPIRVSNALRTGPVALFATAEQSAAPAAAALAALPGFAAFERFYCDVAVLDEGGAGTLYVAADGGAPQALGTLAQPGRAVFFASAVAGFAPQTSVQVFAALRSTTGRHAGLALADWGAVYRTPDQPALTGGATARWLEGLAVDCETQFGMLVVRPGAAPVARRTPAARELALDFVEVRPRADWGARRLVEYQVSARLTLRDRDAAALAEDAATLADQLRAYFPTRVYDLGDATLRRQDLTLDPWRFDPAGTHAAHALLCWTAEVLEEGAAA